MQLAQDLQCQAPQLRVPRGLEVRLEPPLGDAPVAAPDDEAHLLDAHLAQQPLAVGVEIGRRREEAVGLDTARKELAQDAHHAEGGADGFGHMR